MKLSVRDEVKVEIRLAKVEDGVVEPEVFVIGTEGTTKIDTYRVRLQQGDSLTVSVPVEVTMDPKLATS